ncbi:MAG: LytTR family DNA-binding domain-containing protein [Pseudomonadota bacterium]|nr:LytTR family DNA-binding domain-containing protein [Pseudomonadota bacterium]
MKAALPALLALLCAAALAGTASGQSRVLVETDSVRICPVTDPQTLPDFSGPDCRTTGLWSVDPQGQHLWMQARLVLDAADLDGPGPFGLQVVAKASSAAWINGTYIGANGEPGPSAAEERPGRMDAVIYVPRPLVHEGGNTVTLRLSSMHGPIRLAAPMHYVAFGPYRDPTRRMVTAYWPSLITFGAFVIGFLFFGVTALRGEDREGSALLAAASLFAAVQLLAEVSRSLYPYAYPVHELRLVTILACAIGFGLCLNAYLLLRLSGLGLRARLLRLTGLAVAMGGVVIWASGFDAMTGYSLFAASLAGIGWSLAAMIRGQAGARAYLGVLCGYTALMMVFPTRFIDAYFYYAAAVILLFLFYRQALTLVGERRRLRAEEMRARRLETALAEARQRTAPAQIQLVSAGRVDYVPTDTIVRLKGAGDYVEVHHADGRTALYNGSLAGLESELPETFLRVHRSFIVNTAFVDALEREPSGVGRLLLGDGSTVPVSRRIMPKVRSALAGTSG